MKPIFLLQAALSLSSRFFSIFSTAFFYQPTSRSSVFLVSELGPTGFLLLFYCFLFSPFPDTIGDRKDSALGENCLLLMTGFRYTSRFCITIVPTIQHREHVGESFKTVSTKFNIPCQPISYSAHAWIQSPAILKRILCESAIFDVIKYGAACSFTFEPVINRVIFNTCVDI